MTQTIESQTEEKKEVGPVDPSTFKRIDPSEILDMSMNFCSYSPLFYNAWLLGTPVLTDKIPTAAVQFDRKGQALYYLFNEKFWKRLNKHEKMFVFAHEIMHVFLNHGRRGLTHNRELANVAMDLVINHLLLDKFGFDRTKLTHLSKEICFVDNIFKPEENVEIGKSFEYYYNLLKQNARVINLIVLAGEIPDGVGKILEDHLGQQLPNSVKDKLNGTLAGTEAGTIELPLDPNEHVKKRKTWETLIRDILKKSFAESFVDRWMPKNRRIQHLNQSVFLPSSVEDENIDKVKPELWIFADTSGSCASEAKRFFRALKSIPEDKFDIKAFGFDTVVYSVNFRNPVFKGFGGTSFQVIHEYIERNATRTPDMVFVFTDGAGDTVYPKHPKRWHWFLTHDSYYDYIPADSPKHKLTDFYNEQ